MTADALAIAGVMGGILRAYPLARPNATQDIAAGAVWLASDVCYMNGENLQVNGGLRLRGNPGSIDVLACIERATASNNTRSNNVSA